MPSYSVYGGVLSSEVAFPGMREITAVEPTWTFRVGDHGSAMPPTELIGQDPLSAFHSVALHRDPERCLWLVHHGFGLGNFRITPDGKEILWIPEPAASMELLRWVLLGRVMATALYLGGTLCLHGSGVALPAGAMAFLAPKRYGKSTLAAALVGAGAQLATDDVLPIEAGSVTHVLPGAHSVRLSAGTLAAIKLPPGARVSPDYGKPRLDLHSDDSLMLEPRPLLAVYLLAPRSAELEPGRAATRVRLEPLPAFEALVHHASIARLLGSAESALLVAQAAALARSVPVYRLHLVRDLARLPHVVGQLLQMHGEEPADCRPERPRLECLIDTADVASLLR
jgi:hypothetical protein